MQAPKVTLAILAGLIVPGADLAAEPSTEKCELHVSATGQSGAQVQRMARAPGDPDLPNTIASRLKNFLDAESQINTFKKVDLEKYFPISRYDIKYEPAMSIDKYRSLIKSNSRAYLSNSYCYIEIIFAGNGYVDRDFDSRRLYSAITVRKFTGKSLRKTEKSMIDPLNYVDDMYFSGNIAGIDKEISDSFFNNVSEFSSEIQSWIRKY